MRIEIWTLLHISSIDVFEWWTTRPVCALRTARPAAGQSAGPRRFRGREERGDGRRPTDEKGPASGGAHDKESKSFQRSSGCWMMGRLKSSSQSGQNAQGYSGPGCDRIRKGPVRAHASSDTTPNDQTRRHLGFGRGMPFRPSPRSLVLVFLASSAMNWRGTVESGSPRIP